MKDVDLNLLPQLQALLELRNVSHAAERVHLTQPSMSGALARLRRHFNDELLVRSGREYVLTPFAQALAPRVNQALAEVQEAMHLSSDFDPGNSDRRFVVAASDYAITVLLRPLRRLMAQQASGVSVEFIPTTGLGHRTDSFAGVDILVGPMGYGFGGESRQVFRDDFVVVMDSRNDLLSRPRLGTADIAAAPHVAGTFGPGVLTPPDRFFQDRGQRPTVVARVSGWQSIPALVAGTDLVALVPRMLAVRMRPDPPVTMVELAPQHEISVVEALYWHPMRSTDPANAWLRYAFQQVAAELPGRAAHEAHPVEIV
ncbi:LysR substrate-binding domain-containing protein [Citricoccus sp.]|uniref:LysR family transcriptional regulator n=1 Tax=Citricoccus sp. TaxID=1978372 RepID=UPI0028BECF38|nr:LysR substrate-binding domain-containing protein [Citricoccus sp.]